MEWTREQCYRPYASMTEQEQKYLETTTNQSIWRQTYHVQPIYGLLNDPNGFCYFNGQYHLFYQWFPFGAVHGLKHWYHTTSTDLVHFTNQGVAILPEHDHDSHGIFSGSGIVYKEQLYLFYTGNKRDQEWVRHSSQCLAIMDAAGKITTLPKPVIPGQPHGYTSDFRDPKVVKIANAFYMVVGAQREDRTGCALIYQSEDLMQWECKGELKVNFSETGFHDFGFMWECPDLFLLEGKAVLILSPQGLHAQGHRFNNIYHSVALIGTLDIATFSFDVASVQELDAGFDFYAPQTTLGKDQQRLLVGWMGLPDTTYPSDKDDWANCLTIMRELSITNNQLVQTPVRELQQKRSLEKTITKRISGRETIQNTALRQGEISVTLTNLNASCSGMHFCVGEKEQTTLSVNWEKHLITLDRSRTGEKVSLAYGEQRSIPYDKKSVALQLFLDTSSVEIFINNGEAVFTSRLFPSKGSNQVQLFADKGSCDFDVHVWQY